MVEKAKKASSQGEGVSTQVPDTIRLAGGDRPPEIAKQNSTLPLQAVNPVSFPSSLFSFNELRDEIEIVAN